MLSRCLHRLSVKFTFFLAAWIALFVAAPESAFGAGYLLTDNGLVKRWCKKDGNGYVGEEFLINSATIPWWSLFAVGIKKAMYLWNSNIAPIKYGAKFGNGVKGGYRIDDTISSIARVSPFVSGVTAPAAAYVEENIDNGCIQNVDVIISMAQPYTSSQYKSANYIYSATGKRSLITALLHELGHGLGLAHEVNTYNIMGNDTTNVSTNGNKANPFIDSDAMSGIVSMYGIKGGIYSVTDFIASHFKYDPIRSKKNGEYGQAMWTEAYDTEGNLLDVTLINAVTGKYLPIGSSQRAEPAYKVYPGQNIIAEFTLQTNTTSSFPVDVSAKFYYSDDFTINQYDQEIGKTTFHCKLETCQETVQVPLTVPVTIPVSSVGPTKKVGFLGVVLNPGRVFGTDFNSPYEKDLSNNSTYLALDIRNSPVDTYYSFKGEIVSGPKWIPQGGTIELPVNAAGDVISTDTELKFVIGKWTPGLPTPSYWKVTVAYPREGSSTTLTRYTSSSQIDVLLKGLSIGGYYGGDKIVAHFEAKGSNSGLNFGVMFNLKKAPKPSFTVTPPSNVSGSITPVSSWGNNVNVTAIYDAVAGGSPFGNILCSVHFQLASDINFTNIVDEASSPYASLGTYVSVSREKLTLPAGYYYLRAATECLGIRSNWVNANKALHVTAENNTCIKSPMPPQLLSATTKSGFGGSYISALVSDRNCSDSVRLVADITYYSCYPAGKVTTSKEATPWKNASSSPQKFSLPMPAASGFAKVETQVYAENLTGAKSQDKTFSLKGNCSAPYGAGGSMPGGW